MSDPVASVRDMIEETVSASHFRVHFKEIANAVAQGEQAYTVERHGLPMVVVVSLEDAEFLRKHRWEKAQPERIRLVHPDTMPLDLLEEAYGLTTGTTDLEILGWRFKAFRSLKGRTGKNPAPPSGPSG
jgi:prevent-host-death family protein